jgi:hypothetical protein
MRPFAATLAALVFSASALGAAAQPAGKVRSPVEYEAAFSAMARERADGVLVFSTPMFIADAPRLAELALARKLEGMI